MLTNQIMQYISLVVWGRGGWLSVELIHIVETFWVNPYRGNFLVALQQGLPQFRGGRFNTLGPRQYGRHFADDKQCFYTHFREWKYSNSIEMLLKFVTECPHNNFPALVQIIVWCRRGDKPVSEPMVVGLLMHICVTRPQWVKKYGW